MKSNTFKKVLDLGVAKYMGEIDGFSKLVGSVLSAFSKKDTMDVDEGHYTRNFDWDGHTIWTPCDCELAANEWIVNSGKHQKHMVGSNESYATMFAKKCGISTVFGNGKNLYIYRHGVEQHFSNDDFPYDIYNLKFPKEGGSIISISKKSDNLSLIVLKRKGFSDDFQQSTILIDKTVLTNQGYASWKLKTLEDINSSSSCVALFSVSDNSSLNTGKDLIIIDYKQEKIMKHLNILGLQDLSMHPSADQVSIIGKELTILSLKDFNTINSVELPVARSKYDKAVISYSSCGRYLALSYSVNGEIEVRSANDLRILKTFEGYGIPQPDISWDITGRFLACRFQNRERHDYKLFIWDFQEGKEVLNANSSKVEFMDEAFKWHPTSTKLSSLVENKRVQVFELE